MASVTDGLDRWPHLSSTRGLMRSLDWLGTAVFASSGTIAAASSGMNLLGSVVIGCIVAFGGGTLRDVVILNKIPFWSGSDGEVEYFYIAIFTALLTFFLYPNVGSRNWPDDKEVDAISLGTFAVIGAMNGARAGLPMLLSILCGIFTGCGGGLIRDVLTKKPVRILNSIKEMYAEAAAAGAATYLILLAAGAPLPVRVWSGVFVTIIVRWISWELGLRLPTWKHHRKV